MSPSSLEGKPFFVSPKPWDLSEQQQREHYRPVFKDPSWMIQGIIRTGCIALITHWDIPDTVKPVNAIGGYEFLCSYSWKQTTIPTIYVPGTPPKWTPQSLPYQLPEDEGSHYVDQHADRVPTYQFEPIFQALAIMNSNVRFDDIDIVVNRNTLQKLFTFASYKRSSSAFHLDLDLIDNTLFIGRKERHAMTKTSSGFGRNFETDFTSEDATLPDAMGHHRVVKYKLGALDIAVRMEVDGCYSEEPADDSVDAVQAEASVYTTPPHEPRKMSTLPEFFLNVLGTMEPASAATTHRLNTNVIAQGKLVPHNQVLELKSSHSKKASSREQIWFGRVRHLVFAKHEQGLVHAVESSSWDEAELEDWAVQHQRYLRRLVWLLEEIRQVVLEKTNGHAVLVAIEKGAPLQIFQANRNHSALPKEVVGKFWDMSGKS